MPATMTDSKTKIEKQLEGKVAVITGAGSGIGRAAALLLAQHGAKIALVDLIDERSEEVEAEIERMGGEAIFLDTDVSDAARVEKAMNGAAEKFGRIDILFANAGVNGTLSPIEHLTPEDWDRTLEINLKGTFLSVKFAIPHMKGDGGSIVITSSINGSRKYTGFGMSAYSSSKAGQVAFMKMAALELAGYGIRVNAICPGAIQTNIGENTHRTPEVEEIEIPIQYPEGSHPLEHHAGAPEQVAELVLFLGSDRSNHISGTQIYVDGAESLL
ncbi:SDR family NAD(P)-dependent oxidoreductase [Paenibacillus sp. HB172176]|uniref:SDR family oxidoreductase n=1 Tax=Paenibacillus sp. HB172176 TaxID=2493690 RepID=UPI001F1155A0|nr:SDR family NAD(P)-dependent oxidoreductase [Paenibacillus sp. HB172176]